MMEAQGIIPHTAIQNEVAIGAATSFFGYQIFGYQSGGSGW
jgi:hypothetical protein